MNKIYLIIAIIRKKINNFLYGLQLKVENRYPHSSIFATSPIRKRVVNKGIIRRSPVNEAHTFWIDILYKIVLIKINSNKRNPIAKRVQNKIVATLLIIKSSPLIKSKIIQTLSQTGIKNKITDIFFTSLFFFISIWTVYIKFIL